MSSLPQGWHGLASAPRKSLPGKPPEFVSSVPTLRKKWNSPQAPGKSVATLPTYRKSSLTKLPNDFQSKIMPPSLNSAKVASNITVKSQQGECPIKSVMKGKESQAEIANLRKELARVKSENTVLKARVRKLDDENGQKSIQISKLKAEIQGETVSLKKNKDSESILLLRQKILRLEGALKEKEQCMKKLVAEGNSVKVDELKDIVAKYHKQFGINSNGLGSEFFNKQKLSQLQNEKSSTSKLGRTNIMDQVSRTQVDKLRNMLHKLESETQSLHHQIKEKDQEIRRLKLQLSRQGAKIQVVTQPSLACVTSASSVSRISPLRSGNSFTRVPSSSHIKNGKHNKAATTSVPSDMKKQSKNCILPRVGTSSSPSVGNNRAQAVPKLKTNSSHLPKQDLQRDIQRQAQKMRENIAARKIQQGWRNHRKMMSKETAVDEEKAFSLISSEVIAHKSRKEKLEYIHSEELRQHHLSDEERSSAKVIEHAFLKLF